MLIPMSTRKRDVFTQDDLTQPLVLGGSGVVISGVISPLIWFTCTVTLLIATPEPPSSHNLKLWKL